MPIPCHFGVMSVSRICVHVMSVSLSCVCHVCLSLLYMPCRFLPRVYLMPAYSMSLLSHVCSLVYIMSVSLSCVCHVYLSRVCILCLPIACHFCLMSVSRMFRYLMSVSLSCVCHVSVSFFLLHGMSISPSFLFNACL